MTGQDSALRQAPLPNYFYDWVKHFLFILNVYLFLWIQLYIYKKKKPQRMLFHQDFVKAIGLFIAKNSYSFPRRWHLHQDEESRMNQSHQNAKKKKKKKKKKESILFLKYNRLFRSISEDPMYSKPPCRQTSSF